MKRYSLTIKFLFHPTEWGFSIYGQWMPGRLMHTLGDDLGIRFWFLIISFGGWKPYEGPDIDIPLATAAEESKEVKE